MSVRFNYTGDRLLAMRRRLPPVIYRLNSTACHVQFNHAGYHNSCTMKSCSFAGGRDQVQSAVFSTHCSAGHGYAAVSRLSVTLVYPDCVGLNFLKIITRIVISL